MLLLHPPFIANRAFSFDPSTLAMSLLNKLWDDTIAGPPPEKGLGKLRKQSNLSFRSLNSDKESESTAPSMKVTRSIMIVKPDHQSETPPPSPAGSTTPVSPFSGGGSESFRFRRKSDAFEKASGIGTRSPRPPYEL